MYNPFKRKNPLEDIQNQGQRVGKFFGNVATHMIPNAPAQAYFQAKSALDRDYKRRQPKQQGQNQSYYGPSNANMTDASTGLPVYGGYTPPDNSPRPTNAPQLPSAPKPSQPARPSWLNSYQSLADKRKKQAEERKGREETYYNNAYAEKNRLLQDSIPGLQKQFSQTQGYFNKAIEGAKKWAGYQKDNIQDRWGSATREAAQTRRDSSARLANRFAGLNTTDSFGFGSHQQAQENVESDFNRYVQQNLKTSNQEKFKIDQDLQNYMLTSQQKVDELKIGLENTIKQIQSDVRMNSFEKQRELNKVLSEYENSINGVDEEMNAVYAQYLQSVKDAGANQLSEAFMKTGKPQTETDYRFFMKNYDQYSDMLGINSKNGKPLNASQASNLYELDNSISLLESLPDSIDDFSSKMGPIRGDFNSRNKFDKSSQAFQSKMKGVAQIVGKAMEGGVLRAEDVPKYAAILPQMADAPEVAKKKIMYVVEMLKSQRDIKRKGFESVGYDAGSPQSQGNTVQSSDPLGIR